jgi:hypothetical protein
MKAIHWTIAAAAFAFVQPAQAAQGDPEIIIYRFPGVLDDGSGTNTGVATSFHCTNFSGVFENIRIVIRDDVGAIRFNSAQTLNHLRTLTFSTHATLLYDETVLSTGAIQQGTAAIAATSINIICTAMTIDAANSKPVGIALRGIRFAPVPGSQE